MRIVILGAGKMGSWLSRELSGSHDIAIYDRDERKLKSFDEKSITVLPNVQRIALFDPELLINVVSLQNTVSAFKEVVPHISKNCIISDLASIKGEMAGYYEQSHFRFVSVHPMFGPVFADMKDLKEESVIIISESDKKGALFFHALFEKLQVNVFEYSFEEHDRMMAYSLTLPFISSMAFASCVDKSAIPGTTFSKHMRIAEGLLSEDDHLLAEIMFNPYSMVELDRVTAKLEYLKHIIRERDHEEMGTFLQRLRENMSAKEGLYE
jgi:prephenate dehydrogenase